ncbi:MAG: toll/interleukin-1 receptor domain-containing protein [Methanosarcinaceae archaeon]
METNIIVSLLVGFCIAGIFIFILIIFLFGAVGKFLSWLFNGFIELLDGFFSLTDEIIDDVSSSINNLTDKQKDEIKDFALVSLYAASALALYMEDDESGKSKNASEMIIDSIAHDVSASNVETDSVTNTEETSAATFHSNPVGNNTSSTSEYFSSETHFDNRGHFRIFLSHAKEDLREARAFRDILMTHNYDVWLDDSDLLPGQAWDLEIQRAIRSSDVFLVCMSSSWVKRPGYIQKELSFALDEALNKPEGTIYILPTRFENCEVPERLRKVQYIDLFKDSHRNFQKILKALHSAQITKQQYM